MRKIILLSMLLMISACSSWSTSDVATVEDYQASSTSELNSLQDIVITDTDMSDRNFTVAGDISVTVNKTFIFSKTPTRKMVNEKLREEALKIGADAVILVRYGSVGMTGWSYGSLNGKGRAVVFSDK
mgnify:FL=1|jgi:hypothetical protein|tara:strand:- start:346 stop:729 length:384 start_codon:yes stop_codon:yes gene_type:complete